MPRLGIALATTLLLGFGLTSPAPASQPALGGGIVQVTRDSWAGSGFCGGIKHQCANYGPFRLHGVIRLGALQTYVGNIYSNDPNRTFYENESGPFTVWLGGHDISGRSFKGQCALDPAGPTRSAEYFVGTCTGSINGRPSEPFTLAIRLLVDTCLLLDPLNPFGDQCGDGFPSHSDLAGVFVAAPPIAAGPLRAAGFAEREVLDVILDVLRRH